MGAQGLDEDGVMNRFLDTLMECHCSIEIYKMLEPFWDHIPPLDYHGEVRKLGDAVAPRVSGSIDAVCVIGKKVTVPIVQMPDGSSMGDVEKAVKEIAAVAALDIIRKITPGHGFIAVCFLEKDALGDPYMLVCWGSHQP